MIIEIKDLKKLVLQILNKEYSSRESKLIANTILFGELSGRTTHGLVRLTPDSHGAFVQGVRGPISYDHKTSLSTFINGGGNPGMLVASLATEELAKISVKRGFGIVGTTNSQNSIGALSYYCNELAKQDLISIIFARPPATMAPFYTTKALFGTNPLAFGFPGILYPVIFDMSTSAITFGEITKRKIAGTKLPDHVAIDNLGHPTNDPSMVKGGAILPFDPTHKGSGIAMIIEILAAVWTNSSFLDRNTEKGLGNLFIAMSPNLIGDLDMFKRSLHEFTSGLKNSSTRNGVKIRIPGEKTLATYHKNLEKGHLEISNEIYAKLTAQ